MFGLLQCTKVQKPLFAAQQLRGAASTLWTNYLVLVPEAHQVTWTEFCTAFHDHHLPAGLIDHKLEEFLQIKQEGKNVHAYARQFNALSCYTTHHVDIDAKKRERF